MNSSFITSRPRFFRGTFSYPVWVVESRLYFLPNKRNYISHIIYNLNIEGDHVIIIATLTAELAPDASTGKTWIFIVYTANVVAKCLNNVNQSLSFI